MKRSTSVALALALALSLLAKVAFNAAPPGPDEATFETAAAAMLRTGGFTVVPEPRRFGTLVHGAKGKCQLIVAEYDPHGTFAELFRELAAPVGPLRFAWRGRLYDEVPKTHALVRFYLWRELRRVRIAADRAPLSGWAVSPGCDTSRLDWSRLASLPA